MTVLDDPVPAREIAPGQDFPGERELHRIPSEHEWSRPINTYLVEDRNLPQDFEEEMIIVRLPEMSQGNDLGVVFNAA